MFIFHLELIQIHLEKSCINCNDSIDRYYYSYYKPIIIRVDKRSIEVHFEQTNSISDVIVHFKLPYRNSLR